MLVQLLRPVSGLADKILLLSADSSDFNNISGDGFCFSSLNGVECCAQQAQTRTLTLCWCNKEQDPYPCDLRKCASLVHGL
eukprot:scaffold136056_cov25-Tisochrysis_lutea.AAC.1